jgi:hypothetical protein
LPVRAVRKLTAVLSFRFGHLDGLERLLQFT